MSYSDQALLSRDADFMFRLAACSATEIALGDTQATDWAMAHQWQVSAAPGFADAYASALAAGVERPGNDPAVISDAQLLAAVQAMFPDQLS